MPGKGFLDLPPELRNLIYITYLHEHGEILFHPKKPGSRQFTLRGGLSLACKAVHSECTSFLDLHAKTIRFRVRNFDFGPLVTSLNKLDDKIIATMAQRHMNYGGGRVYPQIDKSEKTRFSPPLIDRRICAVLEIVGKPIVDCLELRPVNGLMGRWNRRICDPDKKGAVLEVWYEVSKKSKFVREAMEVRGNFWAKAAAGRGSTEFIKMYDAVQTYLRGMDSQDIVGQPTQSP